MIVILLDPIQMVGWLLILLFAGVLVWLLITRKHPEEIIRELLHHEVKKHVAEDSREPDDKNTER
jgi:hypothetical protein